MSGDDIAPEEVAPSFATGEKGPRFDLGVTSRCWWCGSADHTAATCSDHQRHLAGPATVRADVAPLGRPR